MTTKEKTTRTMRIVAVVVATTTITLKSRVCGYNKPNDKTKQTKMDEILGKYCNKVNVIATSNSGNNNNDNIN